MSRELASLDGVIDAAQETRIPVTDEGFLRGDGAFEVVRVYAGAPFALPEHLDRMERSAANLRLEGPFERAALETEAAALLEARGGRAFDGCLRIVLTRGGRRVLLTEPLPIQPGHARLAAVTYAPTRVLDGVKSLSYAANMLCSRIARERGFDEALMVTPHGRALEAPTSTLFWVDAADGALCATPLEDHVLASITRARVFELLGAVERAATLAEVQGAREAFLASTTREIQPVSEIEGVAMTAPGEVTAKAQAAFRAHVEASV